MFQPTCGVMLNGAYGQPFMGYGYSAETGWPAIRMTATDAESNGAVSALVKALRGATYAGKDSKTLDALKAAGGLTFKDKINTEVIKFQKAKGLDADGIVGPATWKALGAKGVATPRASSSYSPPAQSTSAPASPAPSAGITSSEYFWPGVILGTTVVGAGVWYFFFNK